MFMANPISDAPALSRDAVVQAALDVLESVGIEGLSMRVVADRLGVKAASLYWHVRDKEQLLESVAEAIVDRVEVPISRSGWREPVAAACDALTELLAAHRAAAAVVMASLPAVRRSRLVHDLARTLALAGLDEPEGAAVALVVEVAAAAVLGADPAGQPPPGGALTLAIDSGSWRVAVTAGRSGAHEPATPVGGGGAPSVEVRSDGTVVVRNRRGGRGGGVELSPDYVWVVKVHGGTWNSTLDLSGLRIDGVELDSGSGNVSCTLPQPSGIVPITVHSGIVRVAFRRPRSAALRAVVSAGSAKVSVDGRQVRAVTSDVHWDTPGAATSGDRYELNVASGCVRISMDASAADAPAPVPAPAPPPTSAVATGAAGARNDHGVGLVLDGIESRMGRR